MPIVLETNRDEVIADVLGQAFEDENFLVKYDRPYTIGFMRATLEDKRYTAVVAAKVCRPDKWNEKEGKSIVAMRAARKIADEFIADLKLAEQEYNDLASDIGITILQAIETGEKLGIEGTLARAFIEGLMNGEEEE